MFFSATIKRQCFGLCLHSSSESQQENYIQQKKTHTNPKIDQSVNAEQYFTRTKSLNNFVEATIEC